MDNAQYGVTIVDILLQAEGIVNAANHTLATAIEMASVHMCEKMLQHGADVSSSYADGESSLHCAVRVDSVEKVRMLLQYGADVRVQYNGKTPLLQALSSGCSTRILELLAERTPMSFIAQYLKKVAFIGETVLTCSMRIDVKSWVEYFLKNEDVHCADGTGVSPLQLSCNNQRHQQLLINKYGKNILQNGSLEAFYKWYSFVKRCSCAAKQKEKTNLQSTTQSLVHLIANCDSPNHCDEAKQVTTCVMALMQEVSSELLKDEEYKHFHFRPVLAGGTAEKTKTFAPNENDIIGVFLNDRNLKISQLDVKVENKSSWSKYCNDQRYLNVKYVSTDFHKCVAKYLRIICQKKKFGSLHLSPESLLFRDKISYSRFLWRGNKYKDMMVYVDIVPAFLLKNTVQTPSRFGRHLMFNVKDREYHVIAKSSRHNLDRSLRQRGKSKMFHLSHARVELALISGLPEKVRRALTVAKGLRITEIAGEKLGSLGFTEHVSSEDFITSYMLKNSLLHYYSECSPTALEEESEFEWADRIYEQLETDVERNTLRAYCHDEFLGPCHYSHTGDQLKLACCSKKTVILALCKQIREWLNRNKISLKLSSSTRYTAKSVVIKNFLSNI